MNHPAGDFHWTRAHPERIKRGTEAQGAKLSAADIERLYRFKDSGWLPSQIASHLGVTRITVWRHLKARS